MPKSTKYAKKQKVVHPKSRKAQKMGKVAIHREKVNVVHNQTVLKHTLLRDKLLWVKDYIAEDEKISYSRKDLCDIVESYLKRFDGELEQIGIINGIASRRNNQHASRAAAINLTISKERSEYQTGGIEMPDLCNSRNLKLFLAWEGELRYLQRLKLRKVKMAPQPQGEGDHQGGQETKDNGNDKITGDDVEDDDDRDNTVLEVFDDDHEGGSEET